jgi:DNA mismatch repair protein MutL
MPRINILAEDVANKIAAGEVVERPASAVKELVENSVDAGADDVTVLLTAGGKRSITVSDNGHGMVRDDAILAFERHATSKISCGEDLDRIGTLGFRGEALPSIAAVSRLTLVTRPAENLAGTRVVLMGGTVKNVSEVGAPPGTRVTVNNLYFNTPARAKFLKSTSTELGHSIEIVQRHALARPDIRFKLVHNGKQLFDLPPVTALVDRTAMIWGPRFAREMAGVDIERDGIKVTGLVGLPSLYRAQRNMQICFLNRRPIVSRVLARAVAEAYRGLLPIGKFPVAILFVETDPVDVDINVHPTKREAKFRRERETYNAVVFGVRSALENAGPQGRVAPARPEPLPKRYEKEQVNIGKRPVVSQELPVDAAASEIEPPVPSVQTGEIAVMAGPDGKVAPAVPSAPPPLAASPLFTPEIEPTEAALQVFGTYLIVPQEDRLLIIDQHALHERMTYERLKRELGRKRFTVQKLLVPITIEFTPAHANLIGEYLPLLASIDIQMEHFGGTSFIVTAMSHVFSESRVEDLVRHIVAEIEQGDLLEDGQKLRERLLVLATSACRSSIMAGEPLTEEQRAGLLAGLRDLSPPYTCPHGRPIMTDLTLEQLERSFKRR